MELIDRGAVTKCLEELDALMKRRAETDDPEFVKVQVGITLASCEIDALPTVDAVPVVRCRNCRYAQPISERAARDYNAERVRDCANQRGDWKPTYGFSVVDAYGYCDEGEQLMDADAPERAGQDAQQGGEVGRDG